MNAFPIRVLSELTGVPPTTLRAWERRYGLLRPARTASGHRTYSQDDLDTVRRVVRLLEEDVSIGKAVEIIRDGGETTPLDGGESSPWESLQRRMVSAIASFDEARLDGIYNEALALYPVDLVTANLLQPTLACLGETWQSKAGGIAEEHFFSAYLRNKVGARLHHAASQGGGRRLLLACLPGEQHELGILLFGLSTIARGYRVLYLGANLPLDQVTVVVEHGGVEGVVLSGTAAGGSQPATGDLVRLTHELRVPVMLGGRMADNVDPQRLPGVTLLGSRHAAALAILESRLPAYGAA